MNKHSLVYCHTMAYNEDPYLWAAEPLCEWKLTEHGMWCHEHCLGALTFHCSPDVKTMGYSITVTGDFTDEDLVYMYLRWGKP